MILSILNLHLQKCNRCKLALFNPRPDNDPENVTILFGFTQNIFASKIEKSQNSVGIPGHARIGGFVASVVQSSEPNASGVAGTGATGT